MPDDFSKLNQEWVKLVSEGTAESIKFELAELAKQAAENLQLKDEDQQLQEAKESYDAAGLGYKEKAKEFKLKTKFALRVLGDRERR